MFFETIAVFETITFYFLKVIGMKFQCLKLACLHFLVSVCDCTYAFTYLYTLLFLLLFFVIVFDLYAIFLILQLVWVKLKRFLNYTRALAVLWLTMG